MLVYEDPADLAQGNLWLGCWHVGILLMLHWPLVHVTVHMGACDHHCLQEQQHLALFWGGLGDCLFFFTKELL